MKKRSITGHRIGEWHGKAKHKDELVRKAREMRESGHSYTVIGKAVGVPWRTVCDWVNYATRYDA
jgi:hypothetical protein